MVERGDLIMPHKDPKKAVESKRKLRQRNRKYRKRVKQFLFRLHGCLGTLTDKCKWQGHLDYEVLEFDHRDPKEKYKDISEMDSNSIARIKKEMRKCDLVCANCLRIRTKQRSSK